MDELRFDDRAVVVTGGGRGIGRAYALEFARRGAGVVVADYGAELDGAGCSRGPVDDVVAQIRGAGGDGVACFASVADEAGAASIVAAAIETFGRLDAVVNNAGISDPALFDQLTTEQFARMLDVHLLGTVFVCRAAWPHFVRGGGGRIVNTVSEAMLGGIGQLTSYGAAKGAVFGLTRNLATEGGPLGIHTNAVAPRAATRMSKAEADRLADVFGFDDEALASVMASMPPDQCSAGVMYLAHQACSLNGEVLQVGMGGVSRIAVVQTQGLTKDALTAEDIAEHIEAILSVTDARVTTAGSMA